MTFIRNTFTYFTGDSHLKFRCKLGICIHEKKCTDDGLGIKTLAKQWTKEPEGCTEYVHIKVYMLQLYTQTPALTGAHHIQWLQHKCSKQPKVWTFRFRVRLYLSLCILHMGMGTPRSFTTLIFLKSRQKTRVQSWGFYLLSHAHLQCCWFYTLSIRNMPQGYRNVLSIRSKMWSI